MKNIFLYLLFLIVTSFSCARLSTVTALRDEILMYKESELRPETVSFCDSIMLANERYKNTFKFAKQIPFQISMVDKEPLLKLTSLDTNNKNSEKIDKEFLDTLIFKIDNINEFKSKIILDSHIDYSPPIPESNNLITVKFATDRRYSYMVKGLFTGERAPNDYISYGNCIVSIPGAHKIGEFNEKSFLRLEMQENIDKHIILVSRKILSKEEFFNMGSYQDKSAFIFIHGYKTSFDDAAKVTAQMYFDLGFQGVPIFYSWPSKNEYQSYAADEKNVEWTESHLVNFLSDFIKKTNMDVNIIAHSMGSRALSSALCNLATKNKNINKRIKNVILAAPDIDRDIFRNKYSSGLLAAAQRVTIYGSGGDNALAASRFFSQNNSLGDTFKGMPSLPGFELIDATDIETSLIGHSYFADSRTILTDMAYLINNNLGVSVRNGLRQVNESNKNYWKLLK